MSLSKMAEETSTPSITESESNIDDEGVPPSASDPAEYLARLRADLARAVAAQRELLANNPVPSAPPDPDTAGLMQCYQAVVVRGKQHLHVPDLADETAELCVAANLLANLRLETEQMTGLIDKIERDVRQLDEEYAEQDDQIKTLKEIMEKRKTVGDMAQEATLDAKFKMAKKLFLSYRTAVDDVITECFGNRDDRIKDILQDMCTSYFEGSNLYTAVRKDSDIIGLLEDANIIRRHPHDHTLFRLNSEY